MTRIGGRAHPRRLWDAVVLPAVPSSPDSAGRRWQVLSTIVKDGRALVRLSRAELQALKGLDVVAKRPDGDRDRDRFHRSEHLLPDSRRDAPRVWEQDL